MLKNISIRWWISFAILTALVCLLFFWNINSGSVRLSIQEIGKILLAGQGEDIAYHIVWDIRLPRTLAVMILGGALSVSGFLLQTFFANPIAGPFVLGISSGAKLVVALTMITVLGQGFAISSLLLTLTAFVGAMISMGLVLLISSRVKEMSMLVICGVMIGYICSAITDFVVTFADDANIINLHNWSMGSFSGISWDNVRVMTVVIFGAVLLAFLIAKPISAYQMGVVYAQNMGVNIRHFQIILILLSSLLSACVTAFAGPISFVGVAVPHLMKSLFKTAKPILLIPGCFLGGAAFCLFCDLLARTAFAPRELNISAVTALFGAPIVIFIMIQKRRGIC